MSALPSLASVLPPLHLLSYSTLLGSSLYQTFVNTKVCYTSLSPSAFRTLNKSIFPVYFRTQNALVLFTAVTLPRWSQGDATLMGFLGVMAGLNLLRYGPATERCMVERVWQETRDRLTADTKAEDAKVSNEMLKRTKAFKHNHAMSIHLNLLAVGAMVWYGIRLAGRLRFS